MLKFKFGRQLFLVSCILMAVGCTKGGYQDANGRYIYRTTDGILYYKKSNGEYIRVENQADTSAAKIMASNDVLSMRVSAELQANEELKKQDIRVKSLDGQVELSGYVDNNSQRLEAIKITRTTPGVKLVVDKLSVKLFSFM